ncbi:MAG: hypothetical protein JRF07_01525 [Deltaproteobacteria bacterium]|nr:hypothetical protein [Deltaproteobacteria bacterium]
MQPHADWTLGTRFEVEYQSNASNVVNREEKSTSGDNFVDRHIDIFLQSDTLRTIPITACPLIFIPGIWHTVGALEKL